MSFIALALTLCTFVGSDNTDKSAAYKAWQPDDCNTYFIDAFAGEEGQTDKAMPEQWGDCWERMEEETALARMSARHDHATKPTDKGGVSTGYRKDYLKRFNIDKDVKSIDRWEYGCVRVAENDTP